MENFIENQKVIVDDKINKGLNSLKDYFDNVQLNTFKYSDEMLGFANYLKMEHTNEILNYIFDLYHKDDESYYFKGTQYRSRYNLVTFKLQSHFEERSIEFDNLCQKFLNDNLDFYKTLPAFV